MIACQSCIAGPSVYFPLGHTRFLFGPHHPFSRIGNKKGYCGYKRQEERVSGCKHVMRALTPHSSGLLQSAHTDYVRAPVKWFYWFMIRKYPACIKAFLTSIGLKTL